MNTQSIKGIVADMGEAANSLESLLARVDETVSETHYTLVRSGAEAIAWARWFLAKGNVNMPLTEVQLESAKTVTQAVEAGAYKLALPMFVAREKDIAAGNTLDPDFWNEPTIATFANAALINKGTTLMHAALVNSLEPKK